MMLATRVLLRALVPIAALCAATSFALVPLLVAWAAAGDIDQGFGQGGKVAVTSGNHRVSGLSMALQPDGKLVVAGEDFGHDASGYAHGDVAVYRFLPSG